MASLTEKHYLTPLFAPASVAVVGATERAGAVGAVLVGNLRAAGYRGELFGVNPKYRTVQGVPCYGAIGKVPARVDLAVIATPAASVPDIIEQCGNAGVRSAVVISAGFSEAGPAGASRIRAKMARAVELATILGADKVDEALGLAAAAGRFGDEDLPSILDHLASNRPPGDVVRVDEAHSVQPGTGGWQAMGQ